MNRNKRKKTKQASPVPKTQETSHTHRRNSLQRSTRPRKGASEYSFQSKQEKKCVIL